MTITFQQWIMMFLLQSHFKWPLIYVLNNFDFLSLSDLCLFEQEDIAHLITKQLSN